jgi:hypothetical protein
VNDAAVLARNSLDEKAKQWNFFNRNYVLMDKSEKRRFNEVWYGKASASGMVVLGCVVGHVDSCLADNCFCAAACANAVLNVSQKLKVKS